MLLLHKKAYNRWTRVAQLAMVRWITSESLEPVENPQEERDIVGEHEQGGVGEDVGKRVGMSESNWATVVDVNVGIRV